MAQSKGPTVSDCFTAGFESVSGFVKPTIKRSKLRAKRVRAYDLGTVVGNRSRRGQGAADRRLVKELQELRQKKPVESK